MSYSIETMKEFLEFEKKVPELKEVKLKKTFSDEWIKENAEHIIKLTVIDVETTGTCFLFDEITELACREVFLDTRTYQPVKLGKHYNGFQEPSDMSLLTEEIQKLTNIKPEDLKGQSLDWEKINEICSGSVGIVAHNARFDSKMVTKYPEFDAKRKIVVINDKDEEETKEIPVEWFCSQNEINWYDKKLPNRKQEVLCVSIENLGIGLGFKFQAHRAITDVDALTQLLINTDSFEELLTPNVELQVRGFISGRFYKMFFEPNRFYFRTYQQDKYVQGTVKKNKVKEMETLIMEKAQKERDNDPKNSGKPLQVSFKTVPHKKKY
jgi:DNA polymerase III epsilon subunit-like protein